MKLKCDRIKGLRFIEESGILLFLTDIQNKQMLSGWQLCAVVLVQKMRGNFEGKGDIF